MATQTIKMVFQFRRDTAENWLANKDVIPAAGEPCFVIDQNILKIGDGETTFENLEAIGGVSANFAVDGQSIVLENDVFKLMGFDAAAVGAQPRKNAEGKLEWVVPSTETVEGLQSTVAGLQSDVEALQETVSNLAGGEENEIEVIKLGDTELEIDENKAVSVPVGAGLKASEEIVIAEDGTLSIGSVGMSKLFGDAEISLDGGSASGE